MTKVEVMPVHDANAWEILKSSHILLSALESNSVILYGTKNKTSQQGKKFPMTLVAVVVAVLL